MGSSGNGPYEYIAILKSMLLPIIKNTSKENKIVIIFFANDNVAYNYKKEKLIDSINPILNYSINQGVSPTNYYKENINRFINANFPSSSQEIISEIKKMEFKQSSIYHIASLYPFRIRIETIWSKIIPYKSNYNSPSYKSIALLSKICGNKCKPYIAYIPNSNFWNPDNRSNPYKEELKDWSQKMRIPFIDGAEVINSNKKSDYAPKGGHLSIKGYEKLSDLISKKLMK